MKRRLLWIGVSVVGCGACCFGGWTLFVSEANPLLVCFDEVPETVLFNGAPVVLDQGCYMYKTMASSDSLEYKYKGNEKVKLRLFRPSDRDSSGALVVGKNGIDPDAGGPGYEVIQ